MKESVWSTFSAIRNSSRFTPFYKGVAVELPTGSRIILQAEPPYRAKRTPGLRFAPYSFVTCVKTADKAFSGFGFGEAGSEIMALQKSIAEAVERVLYFALKGTEFGSSSSNGWAAHLTERQARESGRRELLERDAVLVHWLSGTPMTELDLVTTPSWLLHFITDELPQGERFRELRILVSHLGFAPTATTVLLDSDGYAVLSHSSGMSLEDAIARALAEACRIAQIALETPPSADFSLTQVGSETTARTTRVTPEDHALFYAHHSKFPTWIFGAKRPWSSVIGAWPKKVALSDDHFRFQVVPCGPLVVARCSSPSVQSLFFGKTEEAEARGLLNVQRLKTVIGRQGYYPLPHCVP